MTTFILLYTLTLDGHTSTTKLEFESITECLIEKDRIEQYYLNEPSPDKNLEITCKSL